MPQYLGLFLIKTTYNHKVLSQIDTIMKVCLFGSYAQDPMNSLLKKKLQMQGIEIFECNEEISNVFS